LTNSLCPHRSRATPAAGWRHRSHVAAVSGARTAKADARRVIESYFALFT